MDPASPGRVRARASRGAPPRTRPRGPGGRGSGPGTRFQVKVRIYARIPCQQTCFADSRGRRSIPEGTPRPLCALETPGQPPGGVRGRRDFPERLSFDRPLLGRELESVERLCPHVTTFDYVADL